MTCPECGRPAVFRHGDTVGCARGHEWRPEQASKAQRRQVQR